MRYLGIKMASCHARSSMSRCSRSSISHFVRTMQVPTWQYLQGLGLKFWEVCDRTVPEWVSAAVECRQQEYFDKEDYRRRPHPLLLIDMGSPDLPPPTFLLSTQLVGRQKRRARFRALKTPPSRHSSDQEGDDLDHITLKLWISGQILFQNRPNPSGSSAGGSAQRSFF